MSAASCLPKTSITRIPGNSRTFGWFERVFRWSGRIADRGHRDGGRTARQLHCDFVVDSLAQEAASQRGIHADVVAVHIEFVRADDAMPAQFSGAAFDLHPCPKI